MNYKIDAEAGHVLGRSNKPARKLSRGYVIVGRRPGRVAHRIIWERVHGPIPEGMQINHINGIKNDNRISNLELVTPSQNSVHAYRTGLTHRKGEMNGRAILKSSQVLEIRRRVSEGETKISLAKEFGVSRSAIKDATNGKNWRSLA